MATGCPFGSHRVIDPLGALPQAAWKIDNSMDIYDNEILIEVSTLNVDSASFTQIRREACDDLSRIESIMLGIVNERGKHHNPVTGSGGMLVGTVAAIGRALEGIVSLSIGDQVATLVSLTLTPLALNAITNINLSTGQVDVRGQAVLFESAIFAKLPVDMPRNLALAVLDVAGAPAQTSRLVQRGDTVLIIGAGGKSGLMCTCEARRRTGEHGTVIALDFTDEACGRLADTGWADTVIRADATRPLEVYEAVGRSTGWRMAQVTINCVNIPHTEMASIMSTRDGGKVYFFSMATSFTAAALGAEGIGRDVDMLIGNGYTKGHAEYALSMLRDNRILREIFESTYI